MSECAHTSAGSGDTYFQAVNILKNRAVALAALVFLFTFIEIQLIQTFFLSAPQGEARPLRQDVTDSAF